jgi:hypothetical protein
MERNDALRTVGVTNAFTRRLINDGTQIESRCIFCGAVIIGSVMEGFVEQEQQHFKTCPKICGK